MIKKTICFLCILSISFIFLSCKTEPDYRWRAEDADALSTWSVEMVALGENVFQFSMSGPLLESSEILGEAFLEEEGSWLIHLDTLEWFHNHPQGWSEGRFALWGTLRIRQDLSGSGWTMEVVETPWIDSVLEGSIRYKDSIIGDNRGRDLLHRRWLRVTTLTPLFQENLSENHYLQIHQNRKDKSALNFEQELGSFLLPEVYGYPEGIAAAVNPEALFYAQQREWDGLYTASILPKEWRDLRNSGTLYRDFKEGLPLMWVSYNWDWLWTEALSHAEFTLEIEKGVNNEY